MEGSHRRRLTLLVALAALAAGLSAAQIVAATPPAASFTAPALLQIGQAGTFTSTTPSPDADGNAVVSIGWDFDDDGTIDATGASVQHAFATAGEKTVRMVATDDAAPPESASTTRTVVVNAAPTASFTATPNPAGVGETVAFDGSASSDTGGSITSFEWDLDGNGSFETSGSATQSRSYPSSGSRTVRLRVRDNDGATDVAVVTVVVNAPPTAAMTVTPPIAVVGQTVDLSGAGSSDPDGTIAQYAWDKDDDGAFDDGTGVTTTASFATHGPRTVRLRVTDNLGGTDVAARTVAVHRAPTVSVTATGTKVDPTGAPITPSVPDVGETVNLGAAATDPDGGAIARYEWDLDGNGSFEADTGTAPSTTSSYAARGSRTVRVRVTDGQGGTGEGSVTFRVNAPPVARIAFAASSPEPGQSTQLPLLGQTVAFASTSTDEESTNGQQNNTIATHVWIDANVPGTGPTGTFGNGVGVVHPAYATAGEKRVVLRVTDSDGATDDEVATVRVNSRPVADFTFAPQTPVANEPITFDEAADDPDPDVLANPASGLVTRFEWDLDDDGAFGEAGELGERVQATFAGAGVRTVRLRVTDGGGARHEVAKAVDVQLSRPDAGFGFAPADPLPGQAVSFGSTSSPTAGKAIERVEWDFDHDGQAFTPDAEGASVGHAFASHGLKTVAVRATETGGGFDIAIRTVRVNAPPQASFQAAPERPFVGDAMTFSSTSLDPDGPIDQSWDTDGDGEFDDGSGAVATRTFTRPGTYTVALLVADDRGARAITSGQVRVTTRPLSWLRFLDATVSIAGRLRAAGAEVTLLRVRAPAGSKVVVKCLGKRKGCPDKRTTRRELERTQSRFKRYERTLRRGAEITVAVTLDGFIGRYTRFRVRGGKAPKRTDLCLQPGARRPSACG